MKTLADDLAALYAPLAADKGLAFAMTVAPEAEGWCRCSDSARTSRLGRVA